MDERMRSCADCGSEYCPCMLSDCSGCMICSRLAGKDYCECDWQGVCIYNEYIQNGSLPVDPRNSKRYEIQKKIWYEKDLAVMRIGVPAGLAENAALPGSYVFMRAEDDPVCFDMPVSVMRADYAECTIDVAVKASGPKSRKLIYADKYVCMRGIYRNGLLGADKLKNPAIENVLCLTKGVGLAPAVNFCRWADEKINVDMLIDTEKVSRFFVEDCLSGCRVRSLKYNKLQIDDMTAEVEKYDAVMVCASDYFQQNTVIPDEKQIVTNNHILCCGEGICGACSVTGSDGKVYRMCKCKL